ncbi:arp2/3 complex subunit [Malassezia yamatoensis]|uniref:Actin-related protein 2/3 complex subunit 5 n=1 Tax=Malassezia yamatoensis TaxID=253288 RepID=A0AAJ6CIP7_9BASI|nr:arp2/3 complex subunit [Malassezia yamatoensis]
MQDFRALDVDRWEEEALSFADLAVHHPKSAEELVQNAKAKQASVRSKLASNDAPGALAEVLDDAPYGDHAHEAKQINFSLLVEILNATRSTEIPNAIKSLSLTQRDTLMNYLYKGLAMNGTRSQSTPTVNCAVLLLWHERLTQAAGTGCIMRVMTDRRSL